MRIFDWSTLSTQQKQEVLARPVQIASDEIQQTVQTIIEAIRKGQDAAVFYYRKRFDKTDVKQPLKLSLSTIDAACNRVSPEIKAALIQAKANITLFHQAQKTAPVHVETVAGVYCEQHIRPVERAGLYIPGGTAPLPSTVLMLGVPAQLAGCPQIILCSPPPVADEIILAASLCGIDQIYTVGGAQAIAAMALGTQSVPKVDKIFGPGNAYVTEAKQQISQLAEGAAIDMPAGPSELLVIADEYAQPEFIAADLLSQAEHSEDAQVMLVTTSGELISEVTIAVKEQKAKLPRHKIAASSMQHSRFILCKSLDEAVNISNDYAPEHLSIQTKEPDQLIPQIKYAGSVFVGPWSPESAGDYASGTNHVLPTYGYARSCSSLGLADFNRYFTVQKLSASGLTTLGKTITTLARAEQLEAHARAVDIRLKAIARGGK